MVEAEKTSHSCDHLPGEDRGRWAHCTLDLACTEVPHAPTYCCSLLVEHRGGQEEVEGVVGDMEEVVPVDDIVWWSITLLVRPSTLASATVAGGATTVALQFGQQQILTN